MLSIIRIKFVFCVAVSAFSCAPKSPDSGQMRSQLAEDEQKGSGLHTTNATVEPSRNGIRSGLKSTFTDAEIIRMKKFAKPLSAEEIRTLAGNLGSSIRIAVTKGQNRNDVQHSMMAEYLGIKKGDEYYKETLSAFWNLNSHHFQVTFLPVGRSHTATMHILKANAYEQVPYDFKAFLAKMGSPVNVNDVETVNGIDETILDYLISLKGDPQFRNLDIDALISYIVTKHNAKRAKDLNL